MGTNIINTTQILHIYLIIVLIKNKLIHESKNVYNNY